jgi:hypothetical protein
MLNSDGLFANRLSGQRIITMWAMGKPDASERDIQTVLIELQNWGNSEWQIQQPPLR